MVRVQRSEAYPDKILIGSDLPSSLAARRELERWVKQNGYRLSRGARHLSVFENGALVREWMVVERAPECKLWAPFAFLARRRGSTAPAEPVVVSDKTAVA